MLNLLSPYGFTFTFILTEACNLKCKYCYINQKPHIMNEIIINNILSYIYQNNYNMPNCIFELIGGEPLLEIDLIDYLVKSSLKKMVELKHKWLYNTYYSITTNGTMFNDKTKKILTNYKDMFSVAISLDGCKEHHELNRNNSFDEIIKNIGWWKETFPSSSIKSTLTKNTMKYWLKSIKYFIEDLNIKNICMNPIFEEYWDEEDAKLLEEILYKIADYILINKLYNNHYISLFKDNYNININEDSRCGSGNSMLAFDNKGNIYPCLRFAMLNKTICLGNIVNDININNQIQFKYYHKFEQNECKLCEANSICLRCIAHDYEKFNSINNRSKNICNYTKVLYKVNKYFFERIA